MKTICLYHSADLDGHCSGAIVKQFNPKAELIGIDYGDEVPWDRIDKETTVYLVDFSLQPWDDMKRLARSVGKLVWIDHHKSAIELFEEHDLKGPVEVLLEQGKAACELCWQYFSSNKIPVIVWLLGRYDVWDHEADGRILPFQYGMRNLPTDPGQAGHVDWHHILTNAGEDSDFVARCIQAGVSVRTYLNQSEERLMGLAFEYHWKGLDFLCVNAAGINSLSFSSRYDWARHDAVMAFYYKPSAECWTFSLYSPDGTQDLSGIAKEMGGGGHAGACGFQAPDLATVFGEDIS